MDFLSSGLGLFILMYIWLGCVIMKRVDRQGPTLPLLQWLAAIPIAVPVWIIGFLIGFLKGWFSDKS